MSSVAITKTELPDDLPPPDTGADMEFEETGDPKAPYGYEEDGTTPRAPYGYKKNGDPAKKRGRAAGNSGGGSSRSSSAKLETLREPLTQRLVEYFGGPLVLVSPIAAAVWEDRAENTANALLTLAARSPRWRKYIERLIAGSAASDLSITLVGVGTAMLVDTGRIAPDGKVARYYNIPDIYMELYGAWEEGQQSPDNARGLFAEVS